MQSAQIFIEQQNLQPRPEGGWHREARRAEARSGESAGATTIHFLLEAVQRSHWHRMDAAELRLWDAGASLRLRIGPSDFGLIVESLLRPSIAAGEEPQRLAMSHHSQATETIDGRARVRRIVSPGSDFAGFALAPAGWAPDAA